MKRRTQRRMRNNRKSRSNKKRTLRRGGDNVDLSKMIGLEPNMSDFTKKFGLTK
jgi:hypothetical protein